ncbi:hatching enzyme 1.2-like [Cebidichthys violaceus]|uniref:hatching enzyme 1.2-like n=1 Tax=Cebidichthys violaceus TaxID=271503 RepID=UPI0035C9A526
MAGLRFTLALLPLMLVSIRAAEKKDKSVSERIEEANTNIASRERTIIERGLQSFHSVSCIRFIPRTSERDYIHIQSLDGCYSYVGRRFNEQALSLMQQGCLYHNVVQHELLHALGFKHEQCLSDQDQHIRILWENVIPGPPSPRTTSPPWSPSPTQTLSSVSPPR